MDKIWWEVVLLSLIVSSFGKLFIRVLLSVYVFIRLSIIWVIDDLKKKRPLVFYEVTEKEEKRNQKRLSWNYFWRYMENRIKEEEDKLDKWIF